MLFNSALNQAYNRNFGEQDPETLSKLCSNVELQQLIYQQQLQSQLQKQAFQYPLQQNGSLKFSNNKDNEQEIQNSQNYLMNSFLANQGNKHVNNNFNNHQNEDDNEGISRTDSPASSHSSMIKLFEDISKS